MKNKIFFSVLSLLIFTPKEGYSQVANYAFSETTGIYSSVHINGLASTTGRGTSVAIGNTSNTSDSHIDDVVNIPFAFCLGGSGAGTTFASGTSVSMHHNGYIVFSPTLPDAPAGTQRYRPLAYYNNSMSAFGAPLTNGSSISWYGARIQGTTPNRVVIFQWGGIDLGANNWNRSDGYGGGGSDRDQLHFQIRLYETTNVIEFHYFITNPSSATGAGSLRQNIQVGLRGASAADFNVRRSAANVPWNGNSTAGTALPGNTEIDANNMHFNNVRNDNNNRPSGGPFTTQGSTTGPVAGVGPCTIFRWTPVPTIPSSPTPGVISNCAPVPLPVELSEFTAEAGDKVNTIKWTTVSEQNSDYFIVERSLNGADWDFAGRVKSAGNSTSEINYTLEDRAFTNFINYYRLKQVDIDGVTKTYNMIYVDNREAKKDLVKTVNLMGQEVGLFYEGMVIDVYSDGTTEKYYKASN